MECLTLALRRERASTTSSTVPIFSPLSFDGFTTEMADATASTSTSASDLFAHAERAAHMSDVQLALALYSRVLGAPMPTLQLEPVSAGPDAHATACAALRLGQCFAKGVGVAPDERRAEALLRASSRAGLPAASFELAQLLEHEGSDHDDDDGESERLLHEAARGGHEGAIVALVDRAIDRERAIPVAVLEMLRAAAAATATATATAAAEGNAVSAPAARKLGLCHQYGTRRRA
jgi:TPR repeat protein